ncbi:hypothetical protein D3Z55_12890 [Clostridiaceae bacterium]|nr:hypothetical protein [Clostridiaceae bacterium]
MTVLLQIRENGKKLIGMYDKTKKYVLKFMYHYIHPKRVLKIKRRMKNKIKNNGKINVIFLVQFPEMWNTQKSIYDAMVKDKAFSVKILAIPKRQVNNLFYTTFDKKKNESYQFFKNIGFEVLNTYESGKWADIATLEPDYIFLQRPYESFLPKRYSMYTLSRYALLCYVPYGYEFVKGIHLEIEYNMTMLDNIYMIFCENQDTYEYCCNKNRESLENGSKKVFNMGYPRFDLILQESPERKLQQRKTVLWLPRWSIDETNDRSYFFDYLECMLHYFEENAMHSLIIRPHPLMFQNFMDNGVISKDEVEQLKTRIQFVSNIKFDENTDYLDTFRQSDILVADFTSLLIEFFLMRKPILYCGSTINFNSVGKIMEEGIYSIPNKDSLISTLSDLLNEKDRKRDQYIAAAKKIAPVNKNIGNEIRMAILHNARI